MQAPCIVTDTAMAMEGRIAGEAFAQGQKVILEPEDTYGNSGVVPMLVIII